MALVNELAHWSSTLPNQRGSLEALVGSPGVLLAIIGSAAAASQTTCRAGIALSAWQLCRYQTVIFTGHCLPCLFLFYLCNHQRR